MITQIARILVLFLAVSLLLCAQTPPAPLPTDAIFAGAGMGTGVPQHAVGSAAYLHLVSKDTYMFARYDIVGLNKKPFGIQTVVTAGACQILRTYGPVFLGACLDGGTAVAGQNIGGAIGADGTAGIRFGKKKNWAFVVQGGILKTALSSSINPIRAGFLYGWGK